MMDLVEISDRLDSLENAVMQDDGRHYIAEQIAIAETRVLLEIAHVLIGIREKLQAISEVT